MDNPQIVVGSEDCPLKTVVSIVRKSSVIQSEWSTFARQLDVSSEQIKRLRQNLQLDKITLEDLIFEVLEIWIGRNGSNATLVNLVGVVEGHCEANDVGELLRLEYKLQCKLADNNPLIEWKELSPAFQKRVIETFHHFTTNLKFTDVLPKLSGAALVSLMRGKKPHTLIVSLPDELSYYVSRTIVTRNIISAEIFDQNSSDIFLFTGVDRDGLSMLAKDNITGSSRQQLHCSSFVKFMVLDQENHFERICRKTSDPVHLIRMENHGKLRWMKSNGDMTNLRKYIDHEQDELDEGQLSQICDSQSIPVLICDAPGMGKSVLLTQIGHRLVQLHPNKAVLFIAFSEFIKLAKSFGMQDKRRMIKLTLQNWAGVDILDSNLEMDEKTAVIELLLDGYDEVDSADRPLALDILQTIANSFKSIRIWITSRPHLMDELETNLNIIGYNIRPFHEENQVQFLASFWSQKVQLDKEKVELFAKHCLKSLKAKMNSFDNDIAGIPLQCLLIGEVYEDDAVEYSKLDKGNGVLSGSAALEIEIGTITNLYSQLVKIKFQKYKSAFGNAKLSEDNLMTIHSHLSLELLFPISHESLRLTKSGDIDIDIVLKGGILTSTRKGAVTFMHRTFAEYFVAWFIFDKLQQEEEWRPELVKLFFTVMGCSKPFFQLLNNGHCDPGQHQFLHPVICYFLNSMMANLQIDMLPNNFPSELNMDLIPLCEIAVACLESIFFQIFKLFDERRTFDKLSGNFFNNGLLIIAVLNCSVDLIKSLLTQLERYQNFDLLAQKLILREAVKQGKFSILEFLIKEKRLGFIVEEWDEGPNLVCDCIQSTMSSSDKEINERILVLRMLLRIKGSLMNGLNGSEGTTPILTNGVHVTLLKELVRLGANVLVQNGEGHTVLHLSSFNYYVIKIVPVPYHWYREAVPGFNKAFHELITSIPTHELKKLVPMKNSNNETVLMTIQERFNPLPETLDIFHGVGADFNQANKKGDSILAIAIKKGRNAKTIRKLLQLGAQVKRSGFGLIQPLFRVTSLLHIAAKFRNVDAVSVLLGDRKIYVNVMDEYGWTPLDYAIYHIIFATYTLPSTNKLFQICLTLIRRGGGGRLKDGVNSKGESLLHVAVTKNVESVEVLLQLGLDVNRADKQGNRPLHKVAQFRRSSNRNIHILCNRWAIIQILLSKGSDPSAVNNLNETPFHTYLRNKDRDLYIFRLFKSTWDERSLWTSSIATLALRYAISGDDAFLDNELEGLVQKGANFNWVDDEGNSLLHLAVNNVAIKFLIKMGVGANSKNDLEQSPLQKAMSSKSKQATSFNVITCLIENGASPMEITTDFRRNLLHLAARGSANELKYLLELSGFDVNEKDSNGNTTLHRAVACSNKSNRIDSLEKCRLLLEYGAVGNIFNCWGYTPSQMAMKRRYKNKPLIELLRPSRLNV